MGNQETIKRKITGERTLTNPQTENVDLKSEQRESIFCGQKENAEKNQVKLTIEELRSCKGFETVSESEGEDIIESLFQLAVIVCNF